MNCGGEHSNLKVLLHFPASPIDGPLSTWRLITGQHDFYANRSTESNKYCEAANSFGFTISVSEATGNPSLANQNWWSPMFINTLELWVLRRKQQRIASESFMPDSPPTSIPFMIDPSARNSTRFLNPSSMHAISPEDLKRIRTAFPVLILRQASVLHRIPDCFYNSKRSVWPFLPQLSDLQAHSVSRYKSRAPTNLLQTLVPDVNYQIINDNVNTLLLRQDSLYEMQ
ncbi:hypothetical protein DL96DRAFT_1709900 [Flagelloscypha sp. PMI_526]|nr:hypothetical protein DL96DRAFT_1709900 [Flagelloscypha sp. PMI_526]